jgi:hypothetical protein
MISLLVITAGTLTGGLEVLITGEISGRKRGERWPSPGTQLAAGGDFSLAADTPPASCGIARGTGIQMNLSCSARRQSVGGAATMQ